VLIMKINYKLLPFLFAITQSLPASAAPSGFTTARAFAMGGTGVASALPGAAGFYNPALLSVNQKTKNDAFSLFLPSFNAKVAYDDSLRNKIDNYQNNNTFNNLSNAVNAFNLNKTANNAQVVINATKAMNTELQSLNGLAAGSDIGLGTSFALPGKKLGGGFFISTSLKLAATVHYLDSATLTNFINQAQNLKDIASGAKTGSLTDLQKILQNGTLLTDPTKQLQLKSNAVIIGAAITEVGIPLSHEFHINNRAYSFGITPKIIRADLFNYEVDPNNFSTSNFNASKYKKSITSLNFDLGAAYQFGIKNDWTTGISIRNIIPKTYTFTSSNLSNIPTQNRQMKLQPQVTVGISHNAGWHTLAVDLDLTKNRHFGIGDDEQFLSIGAEADLFGMLQLRAGARYNLAHSSKTPKALQEKSAFTAGVGLDIFSVNLDLSGYVSSTQKGAALEAGVVF